MATEILIIDDDPEIRQLLRTCFEREGYSVLEAGEQQALAQRSQKTTLASLRSILLSAPMMVSASHARYAPAETCQSSWFPARATRSIAL